LDNLTHTLAGLLLAEAAVQARARWGDPSPTFRAAAYVSSVFVNNAPDLDFLYAGITERPIGYLLHHRGHSHTVPVGLAIGLATAAVATALARRRRWAFTRSDRVLILALCCVGPFVHVAMDFSNNYGVHPFWPAYAGTFYGDAIFIVEPLFWAIAIPPLLFAARTRLARFVLGTVLALGVAACWAVALAPENLRLVFPSMAALVTFAALGSTLVAWRLGPKARIAFGIVASWIVAAIFFGASSSARAEVRGSPAMEGLTIHDIALTPFPANPFCANALVVTTEGDDYVVRRATVATFPALTGADRCPTAADGDPTAPLVPTAVPSTPRVRWKDEFRAPLRELSELVRNDCRAAALFRFLRVPYWVKIGEGDLILGDLRYDRGRGLDFSDVRIEKSPARCPGALPPWIPPRRDVLDRARRADVVSE
jgi:inner membrane protein